MRSIFFFFFTYLHRASWIGGARLVSCCWRTGNSVACGVRPPTTAVELMVPWLARRAGQKFIRRNQLIPLLLLLLIFADPIRPTFVMISVFLTVQADYATTTTTTTTTAATITMITTCPSLAVNDVNDTKLTKFGGTRYQDYRKCSASPPPKPPIPPFARFSGHNARVPVSSPATKIITIIIRTIILLINIFEEAIMILSAQFNTQWELTRIGILYLKCTKTNSRISWKCRIPTV